MTEALRRSVRNAFEVVDLSSGGYHQITLTVEELRVLDDDSVSVSYIDRRVDLAGCDVDDVPTVHHPQMFEGDAGSPVRIETRLVERVRPIPPIFSCKYLPRLLLVPVVSIIVYTNFSSINV